MTALLVAAVLEGYGCGDGGSGSGSGDKAACQALASAKGENAEIYADLLTMNLSGEMRAALVDLATQPRAVKSSLTPSRKLARSLARVRRKVSFCLVRAASSRRPS